MEVRQHCCTYCSATGIINLFSLLSRPSVHVHTCMYSTKNLGMRLDMIIVMSSPNTWGLLEEEKGRWPLVYAICEGRDSLGDLCWGLLLWEDVRLVVKLSGG